MTLSGEWVALIGLFVTTIAGLIAQVIAMRRASLTSAQQLEQMKEEAVERRLAAKDLVEQTKAEAFMVSEKAKADAWYLAEKTKAEVSILAEETKAQAQLLAAKAEQQTIEMKLLMLRQERQVISQTKEITSAIKDSERAATDANAGQREAVANEMRTLIAGVAEKADAAYHEANTVNTKIEKAHEDNKAQGVEIRERSTKLEAMVQSIDEKVQGKTKPRDPDSRFEDDSEQLATDGTQVTIRGRMHNE